MLPLRLDEQILAFVNAFRVVEERQVIQFFNVFPCLPYKNQEHPQRRR